MPLENPRDAGSFIDVKGKKVFYRKAGAGDPILLLHGFPTSSYDWRKILPQLSGSGLAIAPDLYGFGYSDLPEGDEPVLTKLFPFIDDFVSAMNLQRIRLVAYDWGGALAIRFAAERPMSVSKIVLMNMSIYPDWIDHFRLSPDYSQVRSMANSGFYRAFASTFIGPKQVKRLIAPRDGTVLTQTELEQYVFFVKRAIKNMATLYSKDSVNRLKESMVQLLPKVRELNTPTLLLWGQNDPFVPPDNGRRLNQDIKGSKLSILENTGHFLLEEKPSEVTDMISSFLTG